MFSHIRLVFSILLVFTACSSSKLYVSSVDNKNDTLLLMALDYELREKIDKSAKIYLQLYKITNKQEYLQKAITQSLMAHDYKTSLALCKQNIDKSSLEDENFYRLAIVSALQLELLDESLDLGKKLLKKYNNMINYKVLGNIYYTRGEYLKAVEYFESAYASDAKGKTLISLTNILYSYLDQKQKAISYLETFIRVYGCQELVCNQLITFYREQQNLDGMISVLKMQLNSTHNPQKRYKILNLLIISLEKKDINLAIEFLEKHRIDNTRLLILYEIAKEYKKALKLVRDIYLQTKDKALLGKIAILRFEMASDKTIVMPHVIANFELALKVTDDPSYKNYYGYLLIDYELDIQKGLRLAQEALESSPTNMAYMDSVAWGYFKLNNCKKALEYMKKIVDQVGLENEEIKLHWEKIQECKKKK
jgi:tetratricopeptide (TPR) repeat protein